MQEQLTSRSFEGAVNLSRLSNISPNYSIAQPKIGPIFVALGDFHEAHLSCNATDKIEKMFFKDSFYSIKSRRTEELEVRSPEAIKIRLAQFFVRFFSGLAVLLKITRFFWDFWD